MTEPIGRSSVQITSALPRESTRTFGDDELIPGAERSRGALHAPCGARTDVCTIEQHTSVGVMRSQTAIATPSPPIATSTSVPWTGEGTEIGVGGSHPGSARATGTVTAIAANAAQITLNTG